MSPAGRHMTCNYCLGLHSNSLLKNLSNMAGQSHNLKAMVHVNTDPIASYIWQNSVREPECLRKLREETESKLGRLSRMLVDPPEAQFLRLLVGTSGAKRCIEIGTFTGYNACSIALAIPDDGQIVACDISDEFIKVGQPFWPENCAKKIDLRLAPAAETLDKLIADGEAGKFDFAFIDADKANYDKYYEKSLVLLKRGGFVVIDNALWGGKVTKNEKEFDEDTKAIHQLNMKMKDDERVEISLLQLGDGTFIGRKK